MYEVGLALACRQPSEILIVRDDHDPFLFDVSTIPHKNIDFTDFDAAKEELKQELVFTPSRTKPHFRCSHIRAMASLTSQEQQLLKLFSEYGPDQVFWAQKSNLGTLAAVPRLLDKQLLVTEGRTDTGQATFRWTRLDISWQRTLISISPNVKPAAALWQKRHPKENNSEVIATCNLTSHCS